ncbi:flagellar basal-body MS-ring/collar protein FliF [Aidingimonas halophila]|uniref:Flagellar M-ring protein n=1 Tax=Aidingimonas halophila TaxID=574349 RepID=A0A1H3BAL2_9GAMM|nr:flagellar basal-body MS-ring/collar protein FliF [Aidingimonas halophila]GHC26173.1 flagellar M-ring protein [Aidingimonas halophila]SDX38815.1 flagellar M-ring protein FliF [Aidingimonas halophila]
MSNAASANETTNRNTSSQAANGRQMLTRLQEQLRGNPLVPLLIVVAAVIAIIVALILWAQSPDYRVLYSNLAESDGGQIIDELDQREIPYQLSNGGSTLLVPSDQVHTLRLQLAEQGLPEGGNVGFEIMDNQAFGVSQFTEHVNYQRGLEGELAQSMESLGPVSSARVHIAMAKPSVFVREEEPAKASVVLTLHGGRTLGDGQVNSIVHMVSSSVPELAAEDVSVVDQRGNLLSKPDDGNGDLDGTQLSYVDEIERSYQQRVENILSPILGRDNVRAQVAAQIDFSSREETREQYGPNQAPNEAAIRSAQESASYEGGDELALGVPGALSNTPPGTAASPIQNPADGAGDEEGDAGNDDEGADEEGDEDNGTPGRQQHDRVINYEVDRNVEHIQHRRGKVDRLSVAVVVDYQESTNEDGEVEATPISDERMNQIQGLVRQAMGFSEARGDQLEIVNSPFTDEGEQEAERVWWQSSEIQHLAFTLGRYLLVAIAALLLYWLILRPFIRRYTEQPTLAPAGTYAISDDSEDEEDDDEEPREAESYTPPRRKGPQPADYEQSLKDVREIAQEDPRLIAMIVRSWINQDD